MRTKPSVRGSAEWIELFQANAGPRDFGPELGGLTGGQVAAIRRSIQEFQLGETGEGSHIMRQARIHAARDGDPEYLAALRLFIAEEIRHSRELKAFMDAHGIPTLKRTSADSLFRFARRLAGLELSIAVLVGAEIVAKVYYAALGRATDSTVLRNICAQILRDEVDHVHFQSERLAILRRGLGPIGLAWRNGAYHVLFRLALLLIWVQHGRAMRSGNYGLGRFYHHALAEFRGAMQMMDPRNYEWQGGMERPRSFLAGRIRSILCAGAGVAHVIRSQRNAWVHLTATVLVVGLGFALRLHAWEWCWMVIAVTCVWMAEALNTAVELVCDALCPESHPLIGKAKDAAAGGVLLASCGAVGIAACIVVPRIWA